MSDDTVRIVWRFQDRIGDDCVCDYSWKCDCVICTEYRGVYSTGTQDKAAFERFIDWQMRYGW